MRSVNIVNRYNTNKGLEIVTGYLFCDYTGYYPEATGYYAVAVLAGGGAGVGRIVLEGPAPSEDYEPLAKKYAIQLSRELATQVASEAGLILI